MQSDSSTKAGASLDSNDTAVPEKAASVPYLRLLEASTPEAKAEPLPRKRGKARKSKSILIVEDEAGIRALLEDILFMEGYRATSVGNGLEGVSRFRQQWYDLVLTDLRMPGMSGSDVAKAVKAQNARTPVVIVTGWDVGPFEEELNAARVDRILQKPFDMGEMLSVISELTA